MDAECGTLFLECPEEGGAGTWSLDDAFPSQLCSGSQEPLRDWAGDPCLDDSEAEDVLHAVDPNEVFPSAASAAEPAPETLDASSAVAMTTPLGERRPLQTVYQVLYDISGLGSGKMEPAIIAIELGGRGSQMLFSDSCVVDGLPASPPTSCLRPPSPDDSLLLDLQLTEEEQKLLKQEGVSLPSSLPLTKAEERILKKVRRKIRNKVSAQDSRRRRKEYVEGLEGRAALCTAQNKELQRTVEQLEKHNRSLVTQLQRLQSLIKQTVSKGAQTSTCILIILFSLGLIILPSVAPFSRRSVSLDDDRPTGIMSRNILTDSASSPPSAADGPALRPVAPSRGLGQSGAPDDAADPQSRDPGGVASEQSQWGNGSVPVDGRMEPLSGTGTGSVDAAKPAHADEM